MKLIYNLRQTVSKLLLHVFGKSEVFYINGSETLPPPLSTEEEKDIMIKISNGEEKMRQQLIIHNLRLVVYIAKKFESPNCSVEDLISIGTIGLIKAVNTFSPDRNIKLATYAYNNNTSELICQDKK